MRHNRWIVLSLLFTGMFVGTVSRAAVSVTDPIALTGHGAMLDRDGRPIDVTPEFIEQVQAMYLYALTPLATPGQRSSLATETSRLLDGRNWDPQSKLIARSALIDWLLEAVDPMHKLADVRGKNKLMQWYLQSRLTGPERGARFVPSASLAQLVSEVRPNAVAVETPLADKQQYIKDCKSCGVPIPPDWGPTNIAAGKWVKIGVPLPREENFLWTAGTKFVEVYKHTSTDPEGWCIALPRAGDATGDIKLLGIICVGKASSRACFWDNQRNGASFDIARTADVPLTDFDGGPGLKLGEAGPGTCTSCHAGENPYIVHPGTALETASEFPDDWYKPLVHPSWPQNPGPSDLLATVKPDPGTPAGANKGCLSCHKQGDAGRLPLMSAHLAGYCGIVKRATDPSTPTQNSTMPPSDEGGFPGHTAALLAECGALRPVPTFVVNGVNPKACDAAFTFCPAPAEIIADGGVSEDWGEATDYVWGFCKTTGPGTACIDDVEFPAPFDQSNHNFGALAAGNYRIHLRLVSTGFNETRSWDLKIQDAADCGPTPTTLALASSEVRDGVVDLVWSAPDAAPFTATVQRAPEGGGWADLATARSDGTGRLAYTDRSVAAGTRYGYRLGFQNNGTLTFTSASWVDVPATTQFALAAPFPSPANGDVSVSFSLPNTGSVRLDVLDVAGRTRSTQSFASLSPGRHDVRAIQAGSLPAGVYFLRLSRLDGAAGAVRDARTTRLLIVR